MKNWKTLSLKIGIAIAIIIGSGVAFQANRNQKIEQYYESTLELMDRDIENDEGMHLTDEEVDAFTTYREVRESSYQEKDLKGLKQLLDDITTLKSDISSRKKEERYAGYEKTVNALDLDEEKQDFIDKKKELLDAIKNSDDEETIKQAIKELKELHKILDEEIEKEADRVSDETVSSGGSCYDLTGRARGECFRKEKEAAASERTGNPCIGLRGRERGQCNREYYGRG